MPTLPGGKRPEIYHTIKVGYNLALASLAASPDGGPHIFYTARLELAQFLPALAPAPNFLPGLDKLTEPPEGGYISNLSGNPLGEAPCG